MGRRLASAAKDVESKRLGRPGRRAALGDRAAIRGPAIRSD
jgi:hypothetical protein